MEIRNHIDLHMHSNYSLDGEYTPAGLIELCSKHSMRIAALSDHNCVRGVAEAVKAGEECGIKVIPAVELDCVCNGTDIHLLGYGIDISDSRYAQYEKNILEQKSAMSAKQMNILHELGFVFDDEKVMELAERGAVTGEMIAEAALADKRNENCPLLAPYRKGGARSDNPYVNFFWDYCSQGKAAFLPISYMSFMEAVKLIRETGGIPVIAHPVNTVGHNESMIAHMIEMGVQGLEVYSSYHSPEETVYYKSLAERFGVIQTMGSDFHGKTKPSVLLGKIDAGRQELILEEMMRAI